MTLQEAIDHCKEVAAGGTEQGKCAECAADHLQLAGWLEELQQYRGYAPTPSAVKEMHNQLCYICGKYQQEHLGACNGCKYHKS